MKRFKGFGRALERSLSYPRKGHDMSFVFIGDDNYEEFEQLNDVEIWKKRLLPMGGFDDNTPTEEYITSMSDDMLRARFRLDHARLVSVEMVMDNLTHELAWREVYER